MDEISRLIDWANENEGLLQVLAMIGGIAALLISIRRQRSEATARTQAVQALPSQLVVRPISEDREALISIVSGFGGDAGGEGSVLIAMFSDADDAARAAVRIKAYLDAKKTPEREILLLEQSAPIPAERVEHQGAVRATVGIQRALRDATDLSVLERGPAAVPWSEGADGGL